MSGKIEHIIGEYFKTINHLPYESIDVIKKDPVTIMISIIVKDFFTMSDYYNSSTLNRQSVVTKLTSEMKDMFPFNFYIFAKIKAEE